MKDWEDMFRLIAIVFLLLSPLHLEATTSKTEFVRGDLVTISAYLFNDGAGAMPGEIVILVPPGFELERAEGVSGLILAGHALHASFTYRVEATPGVYRFVVSGGGQSRIVTLRVGPIVAPPAVWRGHVVWFPVFRA